MILHLPLSMPEALRIYPWKCGCSQQGVQEGGEERESELVQPIGTVCELWVRLQVLAKHMRYLCDTRTGRSRPWSHYVIW